MRAAPPSQAPVELERLREQDVVLDPEVNVEIGGEGRQFVEHAAAAWGIPRCRREPAGRRAQRVEIRRQARVLGLHQPDGVQHGRERHGGPGAAGPLGLGHRDECREEDVLLLRQVAREVVRQGAEGRVQRGAIRLLLDQRGQVPANPRQRAVHGGMVPIEDRLAQLVERGAGGVGSAAGGVVGHGGLPERRDAGASIRNRRTHAYDRRHTPPRPPEPDGASEDTLKLQDRCNLLRSPITP